MRLYNMFFVKLRRSRTVFLCLLVVLVFYIVVNQLVINWFLSSSDQSADKFDELQINQKQIVSEINLYTFPTNLYLF
jgi:hypothetical protein